MPQALNAPDAIRLTALSPCQDRGLGQAGLCVARESGAHAHGKLRLRTARGLKESASVGDGAMRRRRFPPCATRSSRSAQAMTDGREAPLADGAAPGNGPQRALLP